MDQSDGAVETEKSIIRHVFNLRVSLYYVSQRGFLYLFHHLGWVCGFEPESISVADVAELHACDGCSEFSEHGVGEFDLSEYANVGIDVVYAVEALFEDESIHFVVEDVFELVEVAEAESYSESIIVCDSMISIPISINSE